MLFPTDKPEKYKVFVWINQSDYEEGLFDIYRIVWNIRKLLYLEVGVSWKKKNNVDLFLNRTSVWCFNLFLFKFSILFSRLQQ